jgi:anthraniloyl-CoA monooxygenase
MPMTGREDEYGGSAEARRRFPLEVVGRVRAVWPEGRGLVVAINATDWTRGGAAPEEAVALASALREAGCDLVEVCAGQTTGGSSERYDPFNLKSYADRIRNEARIPTLATPYVTSMDDVNTILDSGRADLCVLQLSGR